MDKKYAKYPFIEDAKEYVKKSDTTLKELIRDPAFNSSRARAKERIKEAINEGEVPLPNKLESFSDELRELYSYPLSRVIISCINDSYLIKRYSLAEAKTFYKKLKRENKEFLQEIAEGIGIGSVKSNNRYRIHFTDFLKLTENLREKNWKLVNQRIEEGNVILGENDFRRILQEGIRKKIEKNLPIDISRDLCQDIKRHIEEIKKELKNKKTTFEPEIKGVVEEELFPPCIKNLIRKIKSSQNLSHPARFAVVSFLVNIGMELEEILNLFKVSPDFDEEKTRYQIEHIGGSLSGDEYIPPSCSTLKTYGLCQETDWRCEKVSHPLSYYEWRIKSKEKGNEN